MIRLPITNLYVLKCWNPEECVQWTETWILSVLVMDDLSFAGSTFLLRRVQIAKCGHSCFMLLHFKVSGVVLV